MLHAWIDITGVMNEMSAAMGQQDFYPYVLPRPAEAKLHFIHCVVSAAGRDGPAPDDARPVAATAADAHRRRVRGPQTREDNHGAH
jgi:hypothetical protein